MNVLSDEQNNIVEKLGLLKPISAEGDSPLAQLTVISDFESSALDVMRDIRQQRNRLVREARDKGASWNEIASKISSSIPVAQKAYQDALKK